MVKQKQVVTKKLIEIISIMANNMQKLYLNSLISFLQ